MIKEILTAAKNIEDLGSVLWTYRIVCRIKQLPGYIYGFTYRSSVDIYHIFINEALSELRKYETMLHELEHIELGHFESGFSGIIDIYYEQQAEEEVKKIIKDLSLYETACSKAIF